MIMPIGMQIYVLDLVGNVRRIWDLDSGLSWLSVTCGLTLTFHLTLSISSSYFDPRTSLTFLDRQKLVELVKYFGLVQQAPTGHGSQPLCLQRNSLCTSHKLQAQ